MPEKPDPLRDLVRKDRRYPEAAYRFLFEGLEYTLQKLGRRGHVTGKELAEGIRDKAIEEFGGLALMVFDRWNIRTTDDFGEMVFNLVEAGLLGKTDSDSKSDFHDVFDFRDAFPFLVKSGR